MLKDLPATIGTGLHGSIPPRRYWAYYTWQEIDAIAKRDPNATAVINVGAVEQHGPHLPLITDTLVGMEMLGAALARLPDDVMVLALPPTMFGKSVEHITFPGTLTFSGDTLRMVLRDLAASVARSGFTKLVLLGSHGGNVGTLSCTGDVTTACTCTDTVSSNMLTSGTYMTNGSELNLPRNSAPVIVRAAELLLSGYILWTAVAPRPP